MCILQRLLCAEAYGERGYSYDSKNDLLIKHTPLATNEMLKINIES
jgi:hypothetical protein